MMWGVVYPSGYVSNVAHSRDNLPAAPGATIQRVFRIPVRPVPGFGSAPDEIFVTDSQLKHAARNYLMVRVER
jgi:hypothetical protein